jgi:hypothetical protein
MEDFSKQNQPWKKYAQVGSSGLYQNDLYMRETER